MRVEEINSKFEDLKKSFDEFSRMLSLVNLNTEAKQSEIKMLEIKLQAIKDESISTQNKATSILQDASDRASRMKKEAQVLMDSAVEMSKRAKSELDQIKNEKAQALLLINEAAQKQREASAYARQIKEKEDRLKAAINYK